MLIVREHQSNCWQYGYQGSEPLVSTFKESGNAALVYCLVPQISASLNAEPPLCWCNGLILFQEKSMLLGCGSVAFAQSLSGKY